MILGALNHNCACGWCVYAEKEKSTLKKKTLNSINRINLNL